ncbi:MAG: zf-HC2 domain-containing protein [Acidobacteria bacterium]|nr:MAG: zf-HC2 domain-containing protein [Acidobacteriota bacterium]
MQHIADNHEALLDYLYEEGDPAERLKIATHLQECAPCSVAVLEFQSIRGMLRDWTPPASALGYRVVRDGDVSPAGNPGARSRWWPGPALHQARGAQAVAAVLLFAAGMAVSQLRMDYGDGALIVRTRQAASPPGLQSVSARTSSIPLPAEHVGGVGRELLSPLEPQNASSVDTEQLLQRVRAMIDQSEQRQQRELALRLSQVASEVDTQHQADLLRIQQSMGQQQDDFMNYLVRTSGGAK